MEVRKHTRLAVLKNCIARLNGNDCLVGKITDISPCGMALSYQADKNAVNGFEQVDIQLKENGFELADLPCRVVYDTIDSSKGVNGKTFYRCGLRFGEMTDEHKDKLNYLLSNFTNGIKKSKQLPAILTDKVKIARNFWVPLFIDFLLLMVALLGMQLFKRDTSALPLRYLVLFAVFYIGWLAIAVQMEKYQRIAQRPFWPSVAVIVKSNIYLLYLVVFTVVLFERLSTVSRLQVFGTCLAFLTLELGAYGFWDLAGRFRNKESRIREKNLTRTSGKVSNTLMMVDAGLVVVAFIFLNYLKRGTFEFPPRYDLALLMVYAVWGFSLVYAKKFQFSNFDSSFGAAFHQCIRAALIMSAGLAVIIFAGRLHYYSRLQIFGVPAVLLAFETVIYYLFWLYRKQGRIGKDIETREELYQALYAHEPNFDLPVERCDPAVCEPVDIKLKHALEFFDSKLYTFIAETIGLKSIDRCAAALMSTGNIDALQPLASSGHQLIVNLHKTNDVRWFNRYFLEVYRKLKNHGYFIGKVHTIATHRRRYVEKYPKGLSNLFYGLNFIWCRVFPKLPVFKKLYFTVTQGRNRTVSKAEIFGRLYFCGFKIVDSMEIDNRLYFIAQKVRIPFYQTNPTYGPLVQLKRIGFNGELITVYKFRTMFPYSEFLQEYIYAHNSLQEGGKFKDDFRITGWGKFMRALWLDELPMLYNWLKGDLKLFGVRPLSRHYLSLYTDELRRLRTRVLPGLIPPFYADMPKTLDEIVDSENRYIRSYLQAPLKTQFGYLVRSSVNILWRGARSR